MVERLQKIISSCGVMSRRAAEEAILNGRVTVNGQTAVLGEKADLELDTIEIDGVSLSKREKKIYLALNKPKGYVTTLSDEKGRKNVSELCSELGVRLYPVGRLDLNSEGLLIMTSDGDFANRMMHPSGNVFKTYRTRVKLSEGSMDAALERLRGSFVLDGVTVEAKRVTVLKANEQTAVVDIVIGEGRNRQIRRMCMESGLTVTGLCRIKEGIIELGNLKTGAWRYLTETEIKSVLSGS